jgi:sarcosine oxidase subunit alpha
MAIDLRIAGSTEGRREVHFLFDGQPVRAWEGDTVAAALIASGIRSLRHSHSGGDPRGAFCLMGICQECIVALDGRIIEACRAQVCEGLDVRTVS